MKLASLKNIVTVLILLGCVGCKQTNPHSSWRVYRGDNGSTGYSSLDQINTGNVQQLELAWTYHCGDAREGNRSAIQCNPIIVNGKMYVTSPQLKLIALDPATGKEFWKFDPFKEQEATGVNRGVTYWEAGKDRRIFFAAGPYLYAMDAETGLPVEDFGDGGHIDLREGLGRDPQGLAVWATSPGIIYKDLLIQGTALGEGYDAAPGFIRAYDVRSGKIVWTFHTIPQPGEFGYDTWDPEAYKTAGGTNAWAGMSLDEKKGIVYIPLGSPAFDFYGGNRIGNNLFGNCLLALDAATGQRIWHYQLVHHDLWDYDLPAPPVLVDLKQESGTLEAVAQVTKMGMVFVFDRVTGEPVFPIDEQPVPPSRLAGEQAWPTQPFPSKPKPFVRQHFSYDSIARLSDSTYNYLRKTIGKARMSGIYTPPDTAGVVQFPGTRGGAEWGGASVDVNTGVLYVNANEIPLLIKMKTISADATHSPVSRGEKVYTLNNCTMCHGADRKGTEVYPSLIGLEKKYGAGQVSVILQNGKGQMSAYPNLDAEDKEALINFLLGREDKPAPSAEAANTSQRYIHNGWTPLMDQNGYPGVTPPWGTLNAIDLNKGTILWQIPLGEYPELTKQGIPVTGTQNLGGPVVTAGGLLIIGATRDELLRIFDKNTGQLLWQYKLPAGGYATPATYMVNGEQYIVIAAGGGGRVGTASGDSYVAFKLKK